MEKLLGQFVIAKYLVGLSRGQKLALVMVSDSLLLMAALGLAFVLRLGTTALPVHEYFVHFLAIPLIAIPIFLKLGIYKAVVRFIGVGSLIHFFKGMLATTLIFMAAVLLTGSEPNVPRAVFIIFCGSGLTFLIGSRIVARSLLAGRGRYGDMKSRIAIYGAGKTGRQLAIALGQSTEFLPVFFVDDDVALQHRVVAGLNVLPPVDLLDQVEAHSVTRILVAIQSISKSRRREILDRLAPLPVKVLLMPDVDELATGKAQISALREVDVDDLLGRESVEPHFDLFDACVREKNVLVSGAGGSIGSELCRQILTRTPKKLVLLERSEIALYELEKELGARIRKSQVEIDLVPTLASVNDPIRLGAVLLEHDIETVYHAAAYKHVPMVEANPLDGISNNALGTLHMVEQSIEHNVKNFVLISTDKAVRPTNIMGASKRLAEMVIQAKSAERPDCNLSIVRFGNVLASSGSVVPLFRKQIKEGGPVTVTHPDVIRYFMTIPEAAQLVIQAGAMGGRGEVFVLDMGDPVRIIDLARRMIRLYGFRVKDDVNPNGDVEIKMTGLRAGEKLYEELLIGNDDRQTQHPRILQANERFIEWKELLPLLDRMRVNLARGDIPAVLEGLTAAVPEYTPGAVTLARMTPVLPAVEHSNVVSISKRDGST